MGRVKARFHNCFLLFFFITKSLCNHFVKVSSKNFSFLYSSISVFSVFRSLFIQSTLKKISSVILSNWLTSQKLRRPFQIQLFIENIFIIKNLLKNFHNSEALTKWQYFTATVVEYDAENKKYLIDWDDNDPTGRVIDYTNIVTSFWIYFVRVNSPLKAFVRRKHFEAQERQLN